MDVSPTPQDTDAFMSEVAPSAKKRLALDGVQEKELAPDLDNVLALSKQKHTDAESNEDEVSEPNETVPTTTPQKNANRKKLKANYGAAVDTKENQAVQGLVDAQDNVSVCDTTGGTSNDLATSAASFEEDRRAQ